MRIATVTADRVRQAARVLDYRPRIGTRLTLAEKMPAIGFVSDTIASESFAGELIRGGMAEAARQGHTVVVAETGGALGLEIGLLQELVDHGVEQFVYAATATRVARARADNACGESPQARFTLPTHRGRVAARRASSFS